MREKEKVMVILEADNGVIGAAKDIKGVVNFLCYSDWLNENLIVQYIYDFDLDDFEKKSIKEDLGADWRKKVEDMGVQEFNEYFEDIFYLDVTNVY